MRFHAVPCGSMQFHAALFISRPNLKGLHTAPVVFKVYTVAPCGFMQLHAAPCISRLNLKGLYTASVVFEVYTVVPCGSMQLHAAQCGSMRLHASLDLIEKVSIRLLQYLKFTQWLHATPCSSIHL